MYVGVKVGNIDGASLWCQEGMLEGWIDGLELGLALKIFDGN